MQGALFAQTYPRLEVILVDNGPDANLVDEMQERYGELLRVIRNRRKAGRFARDYSLLQVMVIVLHAHPAALWRLPQMIAQRRAILRGSRLSRRERYEVISRFKLDAIELALK
jgi:glycosyltransferase involved in cell wall biosynthesis